MALDLEAVGRAELIAEVKRLRVLEEWLEGAEKANGPEGREQMEEVLRRQGMEWPADADAIYVAIGLTLKMARIALAQHEREKAT